MEKHRKAWSEGTRYTRSNPELIKRIMIERERRNISSRYAVVTTADGRVL